MINARQKQNSHGKVSILIPTRFDSRYIVELCLKSIKKKTNYPDYQIIVCDCGVDDNTSSYLTNLAQKNEIKLIKAKDPLRPDDDLVNVADSDYFVLMHDDIQIIRKNWLIKRMNLMNKNKNNAIVGSISKNFGRGMRFFTIGLLVKTAISRILGLKWSKQYEGKFDTGGYAYKKFFSQNEFKFVPYKTSRDIRHFAGLSWPLRKIEEGKKGLYLGNKIDERNKKITMICKILETNAY